ncbi:HNH endonuclease [Bradyrhizobium sp. Ai1a-2]|uniref:HNH endonuclease n=1 Tax=Bradyrhizobium sp. Ai1a-2 TaxID=196490 RepID=UPI001362B881|nr:HNH endonuclease [Bradyrhizobium sp. Ai1a-2]
MNTAEALDAAETLQWMRDVFRVAPKQGRILWKVPPKNHPNLLGTMAGTIGRQPDSKAYVRIKKDRRLVKRSWLIFLWANGKWPDAPIIDHRDGNSLNDADWNLREATSKQNNWNHKSRRKQSELPMGIRKLRSGSFQARITVNEVDITLGAFPTVDAAVEAYTTKRKELFGDFA